MNQELKLGYVGMLGAFENPERFVKPQGLIIERDLVLKLYNMYTNSPDENPVEEAGEFLRNKIASGEIERLSGMGFTILSKDMLNVAQWSNRCPIVLKNEVWEYDRKMELEGNATKGDLNELGSFCVWELGIVNHEKNAWMRYLRSRQTESDKKQYLSDVIEGSLK